MFVLIGVVVVVVGFVLRFNPLLVVTVAGLSTGYAGGMDAMSILSAIGKAFAESRYMGLVWLAIPAIALLEHAGLKERARVLIGSVRAATTGRVLMMYFFVRQGTAALGLTSLGGQAQMVRPLIAPMAEAAAEAQDPGIDMDTRHWVRAHAAAVDNIAAFFGEDIFIAISSILLIKGFLEQNGISVEPLHLSVWAIPTAICAALIHATRLYRIDRRLAGTVKSDVVVERS
jgi:uncharacterized membrane protein